MNIVKRVLILTLLSGNAFSANTDGDINMGGRNDNGTHSSNPHIQENNKIILYRKIQNLRKKIMLIEIKVQSINSPSSQQMIINLSNISLRLAKIEVQISESENISNDTKKNLNQKLTPISNELSIYDFELANLNDINRI